MKTKQSQQFNHWGQKGLRKIPILSLPLRFLYKALGSSLKRPSTSPSKWSFLFLFSLTYTYIFISVYTHTHNQAPNPPELHLFFAEHTPHSALTEIIERFCLSLLIAQNHIPEKQQELSVHSHCSMFKRARGKRKGEGRGTFETRCPLTLGEFSELSHFSG